MLHKPGLTARARLETEADGRGTTQAVVTQLQTSQQETEILLLGCRFRGLEEQPAANLTWTRYQRDP